MTVIIIIAKKRRESETMINSDWKFIKQNFHIFKNCFFRHQ